MDGWARVPFPQKHESPSLFPHEEFWKGNISCLVMLNSQMHYIAKFQYFTWETC